MKASVRRVDTLDNETVRAMYALFSRYYENVPAGRFAEDLRSKDRVILVGGADGSIVGFSTIAVHELAAGGRPVRVVFSGDTIIDHRHWGSQTFAFAWVREIGRIKAEAPELPLYWLLISKGYRTYRYLNAFALTFTPDWHGDDHPDLDRIRHEIAAQLFGADYDPATGVISFAETRGHLAPRWAALSEQERARPDVRFFLERNPGFARGDELVCLCSLEPDNMKPLTRRLFEQGMKACTAGS